MNNLRQSSSRIWIHQHINGTDATICDCETHHSTGGSVSSFNPNGWFKRVTGYELRHDANPRNFALGWHDARDEGKTWVGCGAFRHRTEVVDTENMGQPIVYLIGYACSLGNLKHLGFQLNMLKSEWSYHVAKRTGNYYHQACGQEEPPEGLDLRFARQ